ncbi:MAG: OpgC domain-containing protein [Pseudomonadota bacterium]
MSTASDMVANTGQPPGTNLPGNLAAGGKKPRDIRLDFFRGAGMFIIFFAHMPLNGWANYIPARFGFSDATEIFVFCSGMASALAFGRLFAERGFLLGLSRIAFRCWQVYWAHIGLFLVVTTAMVAVDQALETGTAFQGGINVLPFVEVNTGQQLMGLFTLTYVPNLFDILPMYLVILAMIPIVMALSRVNPGLVFLFMAVTWILAFFGRLDLPAEPWSDRVWYFNPFSWQLVFFTGFAFMRGWIPAPPINRALIWVCAAIVIVIIPFAHWPTVNSYQFIRDTRDAIEPLLNKTHFGPLRYIHFLALAYLAYALAGPGGVNIKAAPGVKVVCKVGQQALGVFMASILLSMLGGVALNVMGATTFNIALVNIIGCALMVAVAYTAAYFKSSPWQKPRHIRDVGRDVNPVVPNTGGRGAGGNVRGEAVS